MGVRPPGLHCVTVTTYYDWTEAFSRPDVAELVSRAEALSAQLAEIEDRLEVALDDSGLSGKAKVSDLTAKRGSVLRMLGALEKAKRAM